MAVRFGLCWLGPNPLSSSSNCGKTQFVCCSPWLLVSDAGSCTPSLFLQPPGPMRTCGQQHPHRHPERHEDRQHRTAWWVGVSRSMRRRYRATVRCMGTAHCCRARLVPVSRRSSRTPSGPRTMATSTHGGRQVCGLGAKVGITAARSVTGWRLPPCNPGPRASSIPPVADMPHVQPDHQLSEGFRALAGGPLGDRDEVPRSHALHCQCWIRSRTRATRWQRQVPLRHRNGGGWRGNRAGSGIEFHVEVPSLVVEANQ